MGRNNLPNVLAVGSTAGQGTGRTRLTHRPCGRHRSTSRRNSLLFRETIRMRKLGSGKLLLHPCHPTVLMDCAKPAARADSNMIIRETTPPLRRDTLLAILKPIESNDVEVSL